MRKILIAVFALMMLGACEERESPVDPENDTNATETEIYEDPNVINSEPPEAESETSEK